jgi:hypothetical protein
MKRTLVLPLIVAAAVGAALTVHGIVTRTAAQTASKPAAPAAASAEPASFVVHEWGTFTSFSGADGKNLKFPHKASDLPRFVHYVTGEYSKSAVGWDIFNPISLETPVLYFYTDREMQASVQVDFPKGMMTEWYPHGDLAAHTTSRAPKRLVWRNLRLRPGAAIETYDPNDDEDDDGKPRQVPAGTIRLPKQRPFDSHYYAARETDAVPLEITSQGRKEQEKFLFYRGVADFAPPLALRALGAENGTERFSIKNLATEAVHGALLIRVEADTVRFQEVGRIDGGVEKTVAFDCKNGTTLKVLGDAMVRSLIEAGLFEKEARAMVKTWTNDWFGDVGTRILYIAPANFADELLPLKVEPKPTAVARVLVGRHDILTPEQERHLDAAVKKLHELRAEYEAASARFNAAGDALEKKLGRFRWPAQGAAEARLKLAR